MENNTPRPNLLREIQQTQFALVEANEYLDTHPNDQEALAYFDRAQKKLRELLTEYEARYGKIETAEGGKMRWAWVDQPWPWQMEV